MSEPITGTIDEVCQRFPGRWVVAVVDGKTQAYDLAGESPLSRFVQFGLSGEDQDQILILAATSAGQGENST